MKINILKPLFYLIFKTPYGKQKAKGPFSLFNKRHLYKFDDFFWLNEKNKMLLCPGLRHYYIKINHITTVAKVNNSSEKFAKFM